MPVKEPTHFAPAERALQETLFSQVDIFKSETVASQMLNAVPNAFVVLNQQRQIVYANETFTQMLGYEDAKPLYGQRPGEAVLCTHADDEDGGCGTSYFCSQCGAVKAILSGLHGKADVQECRITVKNGDALDLRVWTKPLQIAGQGFVMFAMQDIGHEKRRLVMERIFFHDILNTAGFITNMMELAQMDSPDDPVMDLNDYKEELSIASRRIIDEINAQRQILAAEASTLEPNMLDVDVRGFMVEIIQTVQRSPYAEDFELILEGRPEITLHTDPTLLGRVLINMIKNALEASIPGGTVTVSYEADGDRTIFKVHNKTTMPRSVQLQIFNRSFSTKGDGRGLGTYSIKLLTEQYLGGQVWFETSEQSGTTFFAAYPL